MSHSDLQVIVEIDLQNTTFQQPLNDFLSYLKQLLLLNQI